MMDLNGVFTASSAWSNPWNKPRLDSKRSIYSGKGQDYSPQWWSVDLPGDDFYTVDSMTLMKRGDGGAKERTINAIQFQFSKDHGATWNSYQSGKWFKTG
jgi:hypothetical protein